MSFTVETGSGSSTANSYVSLAQAASYVADFGGSTAWAAASNSVKESALIKASQFVDAKYHALWSGRRLTREQALDWPRYEAKLDVHFIPSDEIPVQLRNAVCELAIKVLDDTNLLVDETASGGSVTEESIKVGPISISEKYAGSKTAQKQYTLAHKMLRMLLKATDEVGIA